MRHHGSGVVRVEKMRKILIALAVFALFPQISSSGQTKTRRRVETVRFISKLVGTTLLYLLGRSGTGGVEDRGAEGAPAAAERAGEIAENETNAELERQGQDLYAKVAKEIAETAKDRPFTNSLLA